MHHDGVEALAIAYRGDVAGSRAALDALGTPDPLLEPLWHFAAGDYDTFAGLALGAPPERTTDRVAVRSALRALAHVEHEGRVVVPVDEASVAPDSPVAGLVGHLMTETAYSAGLLERARALSGVVLDRTPRADPFVPWVRLSRARVLAFLGLVGPSEIELDRLREEVVDWPLGPALVASQEAIVAGVRGDAETVVAAAGRARRAVPVPVDQHAAMAVGLTGLALSTVGRADLAIEVVDLLGPDLALVPIVSRCHVGDLAVDMSLRLGRVDDARRHLARSESYVVEAGSFCAAAVERSRARVQAVDDDGAPDAGPHAEMYLTHDRVLADVAALPTTDADVDSLTRVIAGAGLAAVRAWAGRGDGTEESTHRLFVGLGWDALSPQARVVARLAAAGMRNRDIARTMFLAEKTVESHVATVLATLGTGSRVGIGSRVAFHEASDRLPALTPRQVDVARLVAEGLGNHEIGDRLGISAKTVEKHVASLFRDLGVASRSAIARLVRSG